MPRTKTKTSSFGTSKREGHDATQFYSSNLYNGLEIDEKQEIIDKSNMLQPELFIKSRTFSIESLKNIPDYSFHLIIFDCSNALNQDLLNEKLDNFFIPIFKEFFRILITGGKIALIIDNQNSLNSNRNFQPYHAFLTLEMIKIGFIMRGEVIWNQASEQIKKTNFQLDSNYKHIMIYSKQIMKREKTTNLDTISRDQFLQFTKSIWKHQSELTNEIKTNIIYDTKLFDCYNRILQLYSFESDKILFLIPKSFTEIASIIRHIRKNILEYSFESL